MRNEIGQAIENGLKAKNMSQTELATKLSINVSSISRWIKGKEFPRSEKLIEIIRLLDLVPYLFSGYTKQPNASSSTPQPTDDLRQVIAKLQAQVATIEARQIPPAAVQIENRTLIELLERRLAALEEALKEQHATINHVNGRGHVIGSVNGDGSVKQVGK